MNLRSGWTTSTYLPCLLDPIIPRTLPLDSSPTPKEPDLTMDTTPPLPSSPRKQLRNSSIDSLEDELPKPKKKDRLHHHSGKNFCKVNKRFLERHSKVQPHYLKELKVLVNFKEVNKKSAKDPSNFPDTGVTSVIHLGQGSEGIMKMLGEVECSRPLIQHQGWSHILWSSHWKGPHCSAPLPIQGNKINFPTGHWGSCSWQSHH